MVARLAEHGLAARVLTGRDGDEALDHARAAVADGADALVAVGGDGMVHLALQAVAGTPTPLGIVPAGTGNDLAVTLGLPRGDPAAAADALAAGLARGPRTVDAVRATLPDGSGRWWGCVLGSGFDSAVNERANRLRWPRGPRRYDVAILAELRVYRPLPFAVVLDGVRHEVEAMLVAVGNARSYGAGMQVTPGADIDDGLLDVVVVGPLSLPRFLAVFPRVYRGTHVSHPAVTVLRAREVRLECPGVVAYADGERLGPLPLTSTCVPGALQVLAPSGPARGT